SHGAHTPARRHNRGWDASVLLARWLQRRECQHRRYQAVSLLLLLHPHCIPRVRTSASTRAPKLTHNSSPLSPLAVMAPRRGTTYHQRLVRQPRIARGRSARQARW
ncbi:unnamed protein product, partial [Ectocarpus sp. 8 AP-2014]